MNAAKCRKDTLEISGRSLKMRLGDVNFDIRINAGTLGKLRLIFKKLNEEEELLNRPAADDYRPEAVSAVLRDMLDGLLGQGSARRIFGEELPVPSDLCDALVFVISQIRGCLGL
ncbi:MAG: hypothetical protein IJU75_01580 [Clostridia bacterium]|nr:hypothetical protein [Clostridia bacterium]